MTPKPRDVVDVINQMLEVIPISQTLLINELQIYKESIWNKAPEVRKTRNCFLPVQNLLSRHILFIDEDWKLEVLHIFNLN